MKRERVRRRHKKCNQIKGTIILKIMTYEVILSPKKNKTWNSGNLPPLRTCEKADSLALLEQRTIQ
jgi:hypothetical protein